MFKTSVIILAALAAVAALFAMAVLAARVGLDAATGRIP